MTDAYETFLHEDMNRCVNWAGLLFGWEDQEQARYDGGTMFLSSPQDLIRWRMEEAGCA